MQIVNLNDKLQNNKELSEQQLQIASTQIDELKSQLANKTSLQLCYMVACNTCGGDRGVDWQGV